MKSKIITLAVAFVLGVTAIAFSVRPSVAPSGKGSGKNTEIEKPDELAEIISALPSAEEYYSMAQKAALEKGGKKVTAEENSVKNGMRSISVYDDLSLENSSRQSTAYMLGDTVVFRNESSNKTKQFQKLVAYFTAEAVYYNVKAMVVNSQVTDLRYYQNFGDHKNGDSEQTVTTTSTTIEAEYYLGVNGAFFKFNKYDIVQETVKYKDNKIVEDEEDEKEDYEKVIQDKALEAIRKNYGKWINAFYTTDYDMDKEPDNLEDMTEDDLLNAMVQMACAEISNQYLESLMNTTDTNTQTLKKIAGIAALAGEKSNDYYDKSDNIYTMTPLGRYTMLSRFGYRPSESDLNSSTSNDGKLNYDNLTPVKYSNFLLDLSDGEKPGWYLDFSFSSHNSSGQNTSSASSSMHEDLYVTNIDNTVAPKVSSSKTLYDFIGKEIKKILKEQMEDH